MHYFGVQDQQQALGDVVTAFEHSNPGIKVRLTLVPFGELLSRTLQTAAVHQPPAIVALDNPDVLRAAKAGVLTDIFPDLPQFPDWKNIYDEVKETISDGEHVYGIPIGSNTVALFYNKKIFSDAGIQKPPKTWDDLIQSAKDSTKAPVFGIAFPAVNTEDCTGTWEAFLWSNGGSLLDLASDKAKQALKLWVDLQSGCASRDVVNWNGGDVADGKQYEGKGPALDESFLKSLTRNFSFSAYVRAGVQFNGSGGAGVKNIDVGIGKLWLAYLGGLDDDINSPNTGSFYKHSLDVRLKDIQIGPGKLMINLSF
jgi:ABC-type glycerol-3-phosphate transport system substrate-binding protein